MRTRSIQALVGSTLALSLTGQAWAASLPSVEVVAYNQAGISADTLARAKTEISRIYREAGVRVTWMDPAALEPAGAFAIQLLCRRQSVNTSDLVMGTALGDVHETRGSAVVFYDRVLRSAHERQQDVARVLAYAMAHEMGHLLLSHPAHSPSGIMRSAWDGDDLRHIASGSLQFTAVQVNAIRAKLSGCCDVASAVRRSAGAPLSKR
jgi:hypothetical protein